MEGRSHRNQGHSELEWSWNKDIQEILKSSIRVHGNNVTFHPNYSSGTSAVVGDTPLRRGQQHYWEIEFTSHVYGTDVMVGLATRLHPHPNYNLNIPDILGSLTWQVTATASLVSLDTT